MKNVIYGYHVEDNDKNVYFWEYDEDKISKWLLDDKNYAIVDTKFGYRFIKIVGYGVIFDNTKNAKRKVVEVLHLEEQ